jgi:Ca2+-binding EF-hand superfamily protein
LPTAASAAPDLKALFDRLDRDGNGQLSAEEFVMQQTGDVHAALKGIDLGGMMSLMIVHHAGVRPSSHGAVPDEAVQRMHHGFERLDRDGDGVVSFGEFESAHLGALRQAFDMIDADNDGGIDSVEFERLINHLPDQTAVHAQSFAELDGDGNGSISWSEFLG